jgi:hypothetical protein
LFELTISRRQFWHYFVLASSHSPTIHASLGSRRGRGYLAYNGRRLRRFDGQAVGLDGRARAGLIRGLMLTLYLGCVLVEALRRGWGGLREGGAMRRTRSFLEIGIVSVVGWVSEACVDRLCAVWYLKAEACVL